MSNRLRRLIIAAAAALGLAAVAATPVVQNTVLNLCPGVNLCLGGPGVIEFWSDGGKVASIDASGNLATDGAFTPASVASTGAVSGTTGTFSGAVSGTTITGTGAVTGSNLSATPIPEFFFAKTASITTITSDATLGQETNLGPLDLAITAGETWYVTYQLGISGAAAADLEINWALPANVTGLVSGTCMTIAGTDQLTEMHSAVFDTDASANLACGTVAVGTYYFVTLSGYFTSTTGAGDIALEIAQVVSTASDTTVGNNSNLFARRVEG